MNKFLIQSALSYHQRGDLAQAEPLYLQILQRERSNFSALQLLGVLRAQQGRFKEAIELLASALTLKPDDFGTLANYGSALMSAGRFDEALAIFEKLLGIKPDFVDALYNRAIALAGLKRYEKALDSLDRAIVLKPDSAKMYFNRGLILAEMLKLEEAIANYDRALELDARLVQALDCRGNALKALKRFDEAFRCYEQALLLNPKYHYAYYNRGVTHSELGRFEEAVESYDCALKLQPQFSAALFNRGMAFAHLKRFEEAFSDFDKALDLGARNAETLHSRGLALWNLGRAREALTSYDQALAMDPNHVSARLNRGYCLQAEGRFVQALDDYEQALKVAPENAQIWNSRGAVLHSLGRYREALESFGRALQLNPDYAEALTNRANVRAQTKGEIEPAIADLQRAIGIDPHQPYAIGELLHLRMQAADWHAFDEQSAEIAQGVRHGERVVRPFVYQAVSQSPADLHACSRIFSDDLIKNFVPYRPAQRGTREKIRLGYVSAEFREHATAYLMAGLFELHDRTAFEVIAIDNGTRDNSAMRMRLEAAFDKFVNISALSDEEAAQRIRTEEIDILINLSGYFGAPRMGVFAQRPAPIQINYLGFPATLGSHCMDYILADRIVIPENQTQHYTESVVYLPNSYQANDARRPIAEQSPTRAQMGLPDNAVVFCNFNQSYKFTPSTFASWMRILDGVPNSVLWLLESNPLMRPNLAREAKRYGVAAERLRYAPMVPIREHLARIKLADLFLDTLPYNAHTTASDALWAGLPLLTCLGSCFPGRVAGSLLTAIDMTDLIAHSMDAYERMAVTLGRDKDALDALRLRLSSQRTTCALFDTDRFRRNIEAAYRKIWEIWCAGGSPTTVTIHDQQ